MINKNKEFNKIKPYTYFIIRKIDGKKYHGVRYANKVSPSEDFGKKYFGSSKTNFCKDFKNNPNKFKFRLAWVFEDKVSAINYETKVNRKIFKKDDWENQSAHPAINFTEEIRSKMSKKLIGTKIGSKNPFYGKKHNNLTKKLISEKNKGKELTDNHRQRIILSNKTRIYNEETRKKLSKINKGRKFPKEFCEKISKSRIGIKLSQEHKDKISLKVAGKLNPMYGKTHSEEARRKISLSRIGKAPWNKGLKKKRVKNG